MASYGAEAKTKKQAGVTITHGAGHKLGMRVPEGGSDCAKCEYVRAEQKCGNNIFIRWKGNNDIPAAIDEYCCDEFESKKEKQS